ncbi:MAG: hypothetical protein RIQ52_1247 [Pseudomonadota bacterium]|jgi:lactate dehydrogenase-like 2-hydroxyacid dehydrogenase
MSRPKVIVTRRWPEPVEARLQTLFEVELNASDVPMTQPQLQAALQQADALLPTVTDILNAEVLSVEGIRCRILGNFGVGFNHIDIEAARRQGLTVTNTPDVLTDSTADIAMLLMLAVARRSGEGERELRRGDWTGWRPTHMLGTQVTGKTLGLIGFGRIARAMARKAHHGFGMPVVFFDPAPVAPELAAEVSATAMPSVEAVLASADFVALHCPGSQANRHLINAERLAMMKPGAYLINTARGDVVDSAALVEALKTGVIRGAGLDVFEGEPNIHPGLLALENAVLLPHLGSATEETRIAMGMRVIDNLTAFFDGHIPADKVV